MQKNLGLMLTGSSQKLRLRSQAVQAKLWTQQQLYSTASMYVLWSLLSLAVTKMLKSIHMVPQAQGFEFYPG